MANEIRLLTASEIECRVGQTGKPQNGEAWCSLLLYKDARCDQKILDEVFGMYGWQRKHEVVNNQLCCIVSIYDDAKKQWIEKEDVGVESNTEAVKGSFSDSFKRACFNIGIGRELYTAPRIFITLEDGEWSMDERTRKPKLSAKTVFDVKSIEYDEKSRVITKLVIVDGKGKERYTFDGTAKTKTATRAKRTVVEGNSAQQQTTDDLLKIAKAEFDKAQTRAECEAVWKKYPSLQNVTVFVGFAQERLKILGE